MANKHENFLNINIHQGHKLKPQWDITTQPLKWLIWKKFITPNVGEDVEEHSVIAAGNINWQTHFNKPLDSIY